MVKHIVFWNITSKNKLETAKLLKETLENLNGKIPGLINLEVGIDFSLTETSGDIVLYSEFENKEALKVYQNHPEHIKAGIVVKENTTNRRVVDYEI